MQTPTPVPCPSQRYRQRDREVWPSVIEGATVFHKVEAHISREACQEALKLDRDAGQPVHLGQCVLSLTDRSLHR